MPEEGIVSRLVEFKTMHISAAFIERAFDAVINKNRQYGDVFRFGVFKFLAKYVSGGRKAFFGYNGDHKPCLV
jgi:hypothetical protein